MVKNMIVFKELQMTNIHILQNCNGLKVCRKPLCDVIHVQDKNNSSKLYSSTKIFVGSGFRTFFPALYTRDFGILVREFE